MSKITATRIDNDDQREDFVDLFYKLRDFAFDHPEAEGIIAAID